MQEKCAYESQLSTPLTLSSSYVESFARDVGADFDSLPWPPRSYNCSFCCKEFGSAQALGGHMNVHRREKAKLTHYSLMNSNSRRSRHTSLQNPSYGYDQNSSNEIRTLVRNPNPRLFAHPSLFGSKKEIDASIPLILRERKHSKSIPFIIFSILSAGRDDEDEKQTTILPAVQDEGNFLQSSSFMNLNIFHHGRSSKEDYLSCKRQKTRESVQSSSHDLLIKPSSIITGADCRLQIAGFSKGPTEEDRLDLELRLGHLPQV